MSMKSTDSYGTASLSNEKLVLDSLGDCLEIVRCYGEDLTLGNRDKMHNWLLEYASRGSLATYVKKLGDKGLPSHSYIR
ncbi:putative mitogen-activated protein kinase kinase kinase [Arabidopsis thaliana]